MIRISHASVFVDDQAAALAFYTDVLGFRAKTDVDLGGGTRWLTVVGPGEPDGVELVLEPADHPAVAPFRDALVADGIPFTMFSVDDVVAEHARLVSVGVRFVQDPLTQGPVTTAVLVDTCGNLVQIASMTAPE